jgi:oligopeptide/dipeptide ABC transporter ATP-binding protein
VSEWLLEATDLAVHFPVSTGWLGKPGLVKAVDGVSVRVKAGETLALVGESGCGKSTLGRALLKLVEPTAGALRFEDQDLIPLSPAQMRPLRKRLQMVFQDPYGSLNPRRTLGQTVGEALEIHRIGTPAEREARVQKLLERVGLRADMARRYPHELSGGQRQRVGIARALAVEPRLIVADEPISALDVSIQAQILNLMVDLQEELGLAYVFISHDLHAVRHLADRVAVMYLGKIVEEGPAAAVLDQPKHPYTQALLASIPRLGGEPAARLQGELPSPMKPPEGCAFHPRCPRAMRKCAASTPALEDCGGGQRAACLRLGEP